MGPGAPDPLARETLAAIPRVVRSACRDGGCGRAGAHPVRDLARLRMRLRRAPISGVDADELMAMLVTADLEPELMRAIPQAVRSALGGRGRPLARLRRTLLGAESLSPISEFSPALFATTTCEESPPAWDPAAAPATRRGQAQAAADATPPAALYPFDRRAPLAAGQLALCVDWPAPARAVTPAPALQLPIPALVLSGELDLRTPLEKARALAQSLPGARLVIERGVGHSVLGAHAGGCASGAVAAFPEGRASPPCPRGGATVTITPSASARATGEH